MMKKFLVLYHAQTSAMEEMKDQSPEETKKMMEPWMMWAKKCGDHLVDMGTPLFNAKKVSMSGIMESDTDITGYSVLRADSMDEAVKMLDGHPFLAEGADNHEIEVHECMEMKM
jgi:hypothetical protein